MVKKTSHQDEPGFIFSKSNTCTGDDVVLYESAPAGFDESEGRYTLYCVAHATSVPETNKKRARAALSHPEDWCPDCKALASTPMVPLKRLLPFNKKSPEDQQKELRFMAKLAQGSAEKRALFERIYGVQLDTVLRD